MTGNAPLTPSAEKQEEHGAPEPWCRSEGIRPGFALRDWVTMIVAGVLLGSFVVWALAVTIDAL